MSDGDSFASQSEEEPEYEVERILTQAEFNGKTVYLVKWLHFDDQQCTWEPAESFLTPATLADWEQQLADNDILDPDEVARVQARMDAFQEAQVKKRLARERRSAARSRTKQLLPSSSNLIQTVTKRSQHSSPKTKRPRSNEPMPTKKGIAQLKSPSRANTVSTTPKKTTSNINGPTSGRVESVSSTAPSLPRPTQKTVNAAEPLKQSSADANTNSTTVPGESNQVGVITGPQKLSIGENGPTASRTNVKMGQQFKNLRHQNNYRKKARLEPPPDMSKIDLRSPDEWANPRQDTSRRDTGRDSPLFVPEDSPSTRPSTEDPYHTVDTASSPKDEPIPGGPQRVMTTKAPHTIAENDPSTTRNTNQKIEAPLTQNPQVQAADDTPSLRSTTISVPTEKENRDERPLLARTVSRSSNISTASQNPPLDIPPRPIRTGSSNSILSAGPEKPHIDRRPFKDSEPHPPSKSDVPARTDSAVHRPTLDKHIWRRPSANSQFVGDEVLTASNGRTYRKGEIIINLKFGDRVVGDVRCVCLPWWASGKIIHLKEPHSKSLSLHFQQRFVMDVDAFSAFSQNLDRRVHAVGAFEPYEDTQPATESLTQFLEGNNVGALWEYPGPGESLILVLYSPRAPGWQHLEQPPFPNCGSRLHLAVMNKLPGVYLDYPARRISQPVPHNQNEEAVRPQAGLRRPHLLSPSSEQTSLHVQSPTELPTPVAAIPANGKDRATPARTPKSPRRRDSMSFNDPMDWSPSTPASESRIEFPANFDAMMFGLDRTQKRPRVFITFAESHPAEAKALVDWLSQLMSPRQIYTDKVKSDWSDFQGEIGDQPGVVIFNERYPCYCDMPYLYKYLRPASLSCFNLSFRESGRHSPGRRYALTRLFPRGTVLCITEDSMKNHSDGALLAMKWFDAASVGKVQFWKLVLLPDFLSWILRQIDEVEHEVQERYISMLEIWYKLRDRSAEELSNKRSHSEDPEKFIKDLPMTEDDELVVSPKGLPDHVAWDKADMSPGAIDARDRALLEYFIGWSATNATKYRLFTVVDKNHTNKTEEHSCHIWFREPASFKQQERK